MRFYVKIDEWYVQFGKDADGVPTGRVDFSKSIEESTPFDSITDLAEAVEYHHVEGYEIVNQ